MVSPNTLKNLKVYPKGVSGNPTGRPKGLGVWDNIKKYADHTKEELEAIIKNKKTTSRDLLACQYLLRAGNGDTKTVEYLINRELGTPTSHSEVNTKLQGLHFITSDDLDNDQARLIAQTVSDSEDTRLRLLSTMNESLVCSEEDIGEVPPPDGIRDVEGDPTNES